MPSASLSLHNTKFLHNPHTRFFPRRPSTGGLTSRFLSSTRQTQAQVPIVMAGADAANDAIIYGTVKDADKGTEVKMEKQSFSASPYMKTKLVEMLTSVYGERGFGLSYDNKTYTLTPTSAAKTSRPLSSEELASCIDDSHKSSNTQMETEIKRPSAGVRTASKTSITSSSSKPGGCGGKPGCSGACKNGGKKDVEW